MHRERERESEKKKRKSFSSACESKHDRRRKELVLLALYRSFFSNDTYGEKSFFFLRINDSNRLCSSSIIEENNERRRTHFDFRLSRCFLFVSIRWENDIKSTVRWFPLKRNRKNSSLFFCQDITSNLSPLAFLQLLRRRLHTRASIDTFVDRWSIIWYFNRWFFCLIFMLFDRWAHIPVTNDGYNKDHTTDDNHHNCNHPYLTDSKI